jgi:hypothetical protein
MPKAMVHKPAKYFLGEMIMKLLLTFIIVSAVNVIFSTTR